MLNVPVWVIEASLLKPKMLFVYFAKMPLKLNVTCGVCILFNTVILTLHLPFIFYLYIYVVKC